MIGIYLINENDDDDGDDGDDDDDGEVQLLVQT
jgi:hypothetical protein